MAPGVTGVARARDRRSSRDVACHPSPPLRNLLEIGNRTRRAAIAFFKDVWIFGLLCELGLCTNKTRESAYSEEEGVFRVSVVPNFVNLPFDAIIGMVKGTARQGDGRQRVTRRGWAGLLDRSIGNG